MATFAALSFGILRAARTFRASGLSALTPVAAVTCGLISLAGLLLVAFPKMDQPWLDAMENVAPDAQDLFLTPGERATRADSLESIASAGAELARLRAIEQDVRWGTVAIDSEKQARLRQYLAGRSEILAGDQLVIQALRTKARERQRYALGLPMLLMGIAALAALARRRALGPHERARHLNGGE